MRAIILFALALGASFIVGCSQEEQTQVTTKEQLMKELEEAKKKDLSGMSEKRRQGELDRIKGLERMINEPAKAPEPPAQEARGDRGEGQGQGRGQAPSGGGGAGMMTPPKDGEVVVLPKITTKADGTPLDPPKDKPKPKGDKK